VFDLSAMGARSCWSDSSPPSASAPSYVVGRDGNILFQTVGYKEEEFTHLVTAIEKELAGRP
jgi:hypothetical protein